MPFHKNFDELDYTGEYHVEPDGWEPLTIEFGYENIGNAQYLFWRVKGTRHTFKLPVSQFTYQSNGDPGKYFREFLENFREEMLGWTVQGITAEWVYEYTKEYNSYVKL
jgi:hypothetical protein